MGYNYFGKNYSLGRKLQRLVKKEGINIKGGSDLTKLLEEAEKLNRDDFFSLGKHVVVHQTSTNKAALWFAPIVVADNTKIVEIPWMDL